MKKNLWKLPNIIRKNNIKELHSYFLNQKFSLYNFERSFDYLIKENKIEMFKIGLEYIKKLTYEEQEKIIEYLIVTVENRKKLFKHLMTFAIKEKYFTEHEFLYLVLNTRFHVFQNKFEFIQMIIKLTNYNINNNSQFQDIFEEIFVSQNEMVLKLFLEKTNFLKYLNKYKDKNYIENTILHSQHYEFMKTYLIINKIKDF